MTDAPSDWPDQRTLGRADWTWDAALGYHTPRCAICGDGPLTVIAIPSGDCGEHERVGGGGR